MNINYFFFKYLVYYPVTLLRGEYPGLILSSLLRSQYSKPEDLADIQKDRLIKLLRHAQESTVYYRDKIPSTVDSLNSITQIPLLEKDAIRKNTSDFISTKFCGLKRSKTTGGSTGAPVTIVKNNFGMAKELAATWRGYKWAGVSIGDKQARFWGIPMEKKARLRAKIIDFITNRIRFSAFSFSEEHMWSYVDVIKQKKPNYFYGYVSMIKQFAQFVETNKLGDQFSLKCVITTSEVLTPADKHYIAKVFNCPVYNEYGCGEIGTIAHECSYGNLHISAENMIVEILDSKGNVAKDGESGEITVTDLTNYSMPLIRYQMKDFGSITHKECPCGVTLPILANIYGREYDMVQNAAGEKFHGEFFLYMVEDAKKSGIVINGFQLEQIKIDHLLIKAVCTESHFLKFKDFITSKIKCDFDSNVTLAFENPTEIQREKSGKLRVIKGLQ